MQISLSITSSLQKKKQLHCSPHHRASLLSHPLPHPTPPLQPGDYQAAILFALIAEVADAAWGPGQTEEVLLSPSLVPGLLIRLPVCRADRGTDGSESGTAP